MHRAFTDRDRDWAYARDIRLAGTAALALSIAAFLLLKPVEMRPHARSVAKWTELDSRQIVVIEPPQPPDAVPPRPRDFVASDNGAATDPGIGMSHDGLDSLRVLYPPADRVPPLPYYKVERKPVLVNKVVPDYPRFARDAGIEGLAVVCVVVDTSGLVESAEVYASSGNRALDEAALEAARRARFQPGYQLDRPVRVMVNLPFNFRLE